jgi:hypothetical protein
MKLIKLLAIASILLITGCTTTVPVTARFPDAPTLILEKCPQLKTIEGGTVSIVDFTKTVTLNYTTYYECAIKNDAWIEWYQIQKKIFEEIKGD